MRFWLHVALGTYRDDHESLLFPIGGRRLHLGEVDEVAFGDQLSQNNRLDWERQAADESGVQPLSLVLDNYGNGSHPGDPLSNGSRMSVSLADRNACANRSASITIPVSNEATPLRPRARFAAAGRELTFINCF